VVEKPSALFSEVDIAVSRLLPRTRARNCAVASVSIARRLKTQRAIAQGVIRLDLADEVLVLTTALASLFAASPKTYEFRLPTFLTGIASFQDAYLIVEQSGANSKQQFNRVVLGRVTFREQAKAYLHWAITRDREPIKDASSVEAALNKWILPAIGDMPLGDVNNITVKPLVDKMKESLSARSVNTYVEYVQQVVGSLRDGETGEPIHRRKWDSSVMDLPLVNSKQQCRPLLKAGAVNQLVRESDGEEQALYVLLGATGMRISEALALESKHFINGGRTIEVQQQVDRDTPRVVDYVKTDAGFREVDLSKNIAEYLQAFIDSKDRCCSRPETVRLTCTAVSKHVGLQSASKRWGSMSPAWVGTLSADSGRRGCEESDAKRTSTTSGWDTSRKQWQNSIPA
jgi:integrase